MLSIPLSGRLALFSARLEAKSLIAKRNLLILRDPLDLPEGSRHAVWTLDAVFPPVKFILLCRFFVSYLSWEG